jgi:hypothetical protein
MGHSVNGVFVGTRFVGVYNIGEALDDGGDVDGVGSTRPVFNAKAWDFGKVFGVARQQGCLDGERDTGDF